MQDRLHWNTFSFIVCTTSWIFAVAESVFLSKKKKSFFCYYCGVCFILAKPPKRLELAVPDISNQDLITFNKVVLSLGQILGFAGRAWCPYLAWSWCIHPVVVLHRPVLLWRQLESPRWLILYLAARSIVEGQPYS